MAEKVGDAYVELGTRDENFRRGMNRAEKRTRGFAKSSLVTVAAITAVGAAMGKLIKLANKQEESERDVASALRAHGDDVEKLLPQLKKQARAIQDITRFGDEMNLAMMTTLRNLGVQGSALGTATKQAIGLSKALGLDANSAARYTALASQGEFTILQRYVPALRAATTQAEKQAIVTDLMNKGWQQAQENANTTAGQIDRLANAFGDLGETIGELFTKGGIFENALVDARMLIEDLDNAIKDLNKTSERSDGMRGFAGSVADAMRVMAGVAGAISAGSSIEDALDTAFRNLAADAIKRRQRMRGEGLQDIEGELTDNAKSDGNGKKKPRDRSRDFAFASFEDAIRNIQTSLGKGDPEKEQKKQTSILGRIDQGIQDVNKSIGQMSPVGV